MEMLLLREGKTAVEKDGTASWIVVFWRLRIILVLTVELFLVRLKGSNVDKCAKV